MKIITTGIDEVRYPVGENLQDNLVLIEQLSKAVEVFVKMTYEKGFHNGIDLLVKGSSGAIVGTIVLSKLSQLPEVDKKVRLVHFKKEGENSHNTSTPKVREGAMSIVVDDFICTGDTIFDIITRTKLHEVDLVAVTGTVNSYVENILRSDHNVLNLIKY